MVTIVDGKAIAQDILEDLKGRVQKLKAQNKQPALAVVLVGDDKPSHTYVTKKQESAKDIGIDFFRFEFPASVSKDELIAEVEKIQAEKNLSGMIIQLPVPEGLWNDTREIVNHINLDIDVDCLSYPALGKVLMGKSPFVPPTPGAIMHILKYHQVSLDGKNICLVGRGDLIGKPLAGMLLNEKVAFSVHGRSTKNLADFTLAADIIITGVGKKDVVTSDMVSEGAMIIDAGVTFVDGKMYGDVDFAGVKDKASLITPVPGGVGPITVAKLLENTVISCELRL
ncbi:MAG: bifunctional methylenetetrahydrofolate dehydrogenase/methenyltetrahydrofolate cyclohydrolase [Candidatus Buchananbacteria bacterium CG10_big_fil_rev_8_21_14_0_10_42_9]|uniref:Bifunctional protein FolD n=1 Tax=Candidatus Buchananbacteria bacterium CG10_big_fil_rev_8_21_14_0_10_42_9 TaxID=1974526 RepID=A0A2H0W148_9BACT|nr:MAG: bifunctional methylenetetrahydrofolate dehydrogenase/methenyltetrahydrofolate cyclohydrolase [Candidatus Buchananbacteria bacterium CG10_big_fil_rev_8_21_14_0_10_42_9]